MKIAEASKRPGFSPDTLRSDDRLRKPVTIWAVRIGDELYVRSVNGRDSAWFRGVQTRHEGDIRAGGAEKDVSFVEESGANSIDPVDAGYRSKDRRYAASILDHITSAEARAATIQLVRRARSGWAICSGSGAHARYQKTLLTLTRCEGV